MKKQLKFAFFAIVALAIGTANAQQITGDVTKETGINYGTTTTGGSIRVIDNKGTIKYLQAKNGITLLTNTTADVTTTTWQLGGTITDDTYIDVNGKAFALDGLKLITTEAPSTDATTGSAHGTGTGYTFLVRDEATGETKKLLASDVVKNGQQMFTATADQTAFTLTNSPTPNLTSYAKVWVYRNGAKLVANLDYTVTGNVVTLVPQTTAPNDWKVYAGDVIEVQFNY